MPVYFNGLLLGLSLIMALGPQNVFLIRQGVLRRHALLSATICFICDVILVCVSLTGLNKALELRPNLKVWITWFGVGFLSYYGLQALKRAVSKSNVESKEEHKSSNRLQILLLALGFSLLNPHAIIDSLVIIGGGGSQYPGQEYAFLSGVITASFLWFFSLTFITYHFSEFLARGSVWQRIELSSGLLMLFLGYKLAIT